MDLVVREGDVVLVHVVPLLDADLLRPGPGLGGHQLFQVAYGVVLAASTQPVGTAASGRAAKRQTTRGGADAHLHLTLTFFPSRSLRTTSIIGQEPGARPWCLCQRGGCWWGAAVAGGRGRWRWQARSGWRGAGCCCLASCRDTSAVLPLVPTPQHAGPAGIISLRAG